MSEKYQIIGFDFDDILFNFNGTISLWHNDLYGTNVALKDIVIYELENVWKCTKEEALKRVADFYQTSEHANAQPIFDAVNGVKTLSKDATLLIITSRPEELREVTQQWLNKHFPDLFKEIYFINYFHGAGKKRTKSEVCKELGIEIFIDDSLYHANDISSIGTPVLLLNTPWNQGEVKPPITRVYSWKEIVEKLS